MSSIYLFTAGRFTLPSCPAMRDARMAEKCFNEIFKHALICPSSYDTSEVPPVILPVRFTYQRHWFPFHGVQIYSSLCIRRIRILVRMPFPLRAVFNAPHQPVYGLSGKNLAVMGRQIIVKIQILHTFQCIVLCFNRRMVLEYKAHDRRKGIPGQQ